MAAPKRRRVFVQRANGLHSQTNRSGAQPREAAIARPHTSLTRRTHERDDLVDVVTGRAGSPLPTDKRLELALGITCHAVYHAGQVQLVKRRRGE